MIRSEVFDEFVKLATEKGLISEADHAEHTEQNTKNPRWDSMDISTIEALYGVKPDLPEGMEYKHNIMEDAHPNAVVIAPSYDKLHGLVENNIERQNILMHILYKAPESGSPNQGLYPMRPQILYPATKYAQNDLLMSLVRVANDMDNKDQDALRVLADTCLDQIHDGFRKEAFLPAIAGVAALLGAIWAQQHLPDVDQGLKENFDRLQNELNDFRTADVTLGFGHKYDDELKQDVTQLSDKLATFWRVYMTAEPLLRQLEKPKDAKELLASQAEPVVQESLKAYDTLYSVATQMDPFLQKLSDNFNNPDYKARHTEEKGAVTSLIDSVPFLHGGKSSLTADDFDDVVNAISPFRDSVKRLLGVLKGAKTFENTAKAEMAASKSFYGATPEEPKPQTAKDIDEGASGLEEELSGFLGLK